MLRGPAFIRVPLAARLALVLAPALMLATAAAAGPPAAPAAATPSFTTLGQESVDGITQVSVSYDVPGGAVRGTLFLPPDTDAHPGVLLNHDGDHGVDATLMRRARDLAKLGYVVLAPAYRSDAGSLGKPRANDREVEDVLAGARILARYPRVADPQLAILGTSHGAFVSMLAVMQEPRQFRCVAQASGAIDVPRTAAKVKVPALLQHGWKDDVVEIGDAMYLSAEMRKSGNGTAKLHEYSLLGHNLWFADDAGAFGADQVSQANWAWDDLTTFLGTYMLRGQTAQRPAPVQKATEAGM